MTRLSLDHPTWNTLKNAYGSAGDIPHLLNELGQPVESWGWDDEPMYSLWSSLWHQGDVYSASYAAVPYLLDAVPDAPPEGQRSLLQLVTCILASSVEDNAPEVDPASLADFKFERTRLEKLAIRALADIESDEQELGLLLGAIAIAKKGYRMGNFLMQVDNGWQCQECGEPLPGANATG